ncbi:cytochrome c [Polynucleobacter necessarius]|uniref:cytochrome c n=1 Tax=Polynucleobacter necessarius TaxID=576610 RepID=UPI0013B05A50|nr:cytochrome c [Polynucleobacter necessarius]
MKFKIFALLICVSPLLGCVPKIPQTKTSLSLKQLMEWVIDPNADVLWDSVKTISNAQGTIEIYPKTDAQWESVRNSAAVLAESGNLLMIEGRAKDNQLWAAYAKQLSKAAEEALKAAQNKNKDDLFDAGGNIYNACKSCHDKYAEFDKQAGK